MRLHLPLRVRLAAWCAGSILAILTPVFIGVLLVQWQAMRAALDHHLEEDLEVAAEMLVPSGTGVAWRTDSDRDLGYDAAPQRWVEVYASDGRPLYFRGLPARSPIRDSLPGVDSVHAGLSTRQTPAGAFVRLRAADRRVGDQVVRIRVARSEDPLRADLLWLFVFFSVAAPGSVVVSAAVGYGIAGRALAPLSAMADRAQSISADHLSERLPVESDDELGQLARIFNETFARLEGSFSRLKQFTTDASHELRTPLTAIRSVGEVGLREAREPGQYQEVIGSMLEEADRLTRMVDTLLTFARWESGRVRPVRHVVDLRELADEVCAQLSVLAEEAGVRLDVNTGPAVPTLSDPVMVRQAMTNVIDNAIKFTGQGSAVHVSLREEPHRVALVVDDQGPGIPEAERGRVIERFYRVDQGADRPGRTGSGLGLAIAYWAVTANGGTLAVEASPAGGARLILWLPRLPAHT